MLLSAIDGPDKVVSIAMQHEHIDRIKQLGSNLSNQDWIKWTEFILPDDSLPKNYFSFQPQPYNPLLGDSISATALKNITVKINNAPLQMFHNEAFMDVYFGCNDSTIRIPKNTAIRMRYTDKEFLFYLYCNIAKNVPQRIPFPDATIPTNEIKLDIVAVQ
jgi:hypothetical protein